MNVAIDDPYQYGDIDIYALWAILTAGWYITVPLLGWSTTLRRLNARPVVVCWSVLVAVGVVCGAVPFLKSIKTGIFRVYWEGAAAICSRIPGGDTKPPSEWDRALPYFESNTVWELYNCTTQCGSLNPKLKLRHNTPMVPAIQTEFANWAGLPDLHSKISMIELSVIVLPIVILQYVHVLWSDRRSPAEARNRIHDLIHRYGTDWPSKTVSSFALIVASIIYIHALLMLIICPLLFFFNVFFNEWFLAYYPQGEAVTAMSQWSPVVSVILVVIGVSLAQIRRNVLAKLNPAHYVWKKHPAQTHPLPERLQDNSDASGPSSSSSLIPRYQRWTTFGFLYAGRLVQRSVRYFRCEWYEYRGWLRDPVTESQSSQSSDSHTTAPILPVLRTQTPLFFHLNQSNEQIVLIHPETW